jgi:hypothetical protein
MSKVIECSVLSLEERNRAADAVSPPLLFNVLTNRHLHDQKSHRLFSASQVPCVIFIIVCCSFILSLTTTSSLLTIPDRRELVRNQPNPRQDDKVLEENFKISSLFSTTASSYGSAFVGLKGSNVLDNAPFGDGERMYV